MRCVTGGSVVVLSLFIVTPIVVVLCQVLVLLCSTVKPVLTGHSKIDKVKVLKANGSLMKVESIAECSFGAFCNTFDLH